MTKSQVLAELFRLTAELVPVAPAEAEDLAALRRRLAESLFPQSGVGVSSSVPADPAKRPILDLLQDIVDEVADAPMRRCRVLRRLLPLRSALQPASFPSRSGGQAIVRTFGPMLERGERFVFFDLFEGADFKAVNFGTPFLALLLPADTEDEDGTMTFGAGSIWIKASLFDPNILRGFVGLRVASGSLEGSQATDWTLSIVLDPAPLATSPDGPGKDAGRAKATRPQTVIFTMKPTGMQIEAGAGRLSIYGAATELNRMDEPAVYWEPSGAVLIPFAASETELEPTEVHSPLLQPAGIWKVAKAGWLLPVSPPFLPPDQLGEAADAGAMAIVVEDGLSVAWRGLAGGRYAARNATIAVDSCDLALVADGRTPRVAQQQLALWRKSSIDLDLTTDFRLHFVSSRKGAEALFSNIPIAAHLDRPLSAGGQRPPLRFESASVSLFYTQELGGDEFVDLAAFRPADPREIVPFALVNALLEANPADTLTLWGLIQDARQVTGATLRLEFGLHAIFPFLPDPYAADFTARSEPAPLPAKARLVATIGGTWPSFETLKLSIAAVSDEPLDLAKALLPEGRALEPGDQDEQALNDLFELILRGDEIFSVEFPLHPPLQLLDLSGNADQFGVRTALRKNLGWPPSIRIEGLHLVADTRNLRLFAQPQVQWEPVRTHPSDLRPGFPQPLRSKDDGGPLVMGVGVADDTFHLVAIAPNPILQEMVAIGARETALAAIRFTLPFGIKAVAAIAGEDPLARPAVTLNQPLFGPLTGGLQISVRAATPKGMPGVAIQTLNGTTGASVLDDIAAFFNDEFHPREGNASLPLLRIDLSGYGASTSSQWVNEQAPPLGITKVEFEMLVGRANVEVIEAQSILWPCMARVVRRITIRREGDGTVLRRDSGWVAASQGLFERPDCACIFHLGPVVGMFEIREIRETTQRVRLSSNVDLQAVYFDTDIAFANVVRGHGSEQEGLGGVRVGFVPARRQLGFVQLINPDTPQKAPLTPAQLAELLSKHGPVGGPVDCELDIGGSQQRMRLASLYSAVAPPPAGGDLQFAVAVYGAPELPREGQWSVVRRRNASLDSPEPEPIDPRLGVPLIRVGRMFQVGGNPNAFRFADPVDLLSPADAVVDYALLLATQTFRVLFPRVKIQPGSNEITSDVAPVLADALAMTAAIGLFPRPKHAISFPTSNYSLKILGPGRLRLDPAPLRHTMPMPPRTLDLAKAAGIHAFTEYRGGDRRRTGPAKIELRFDSSAQPSWSLLIGPVSTVTNIDPFGPIMRLVINLESTSMSPPKGNDPLVEFGGALRAVEELIAIMKEFGLPVAMSIETPNSPHHEHTKKLKAALKLKHDLKDVEVFGRFTTEGHLQIGLEVGSKRYTQEHPTMVPLDPGASIELFAEAEGTATVPILGPIRGGGMLRLQFAAGYEARTGKTLCEFRLAFATVASVAEKIAKIVEVKVEIRYGYVIVIDIAQRKAHPGILIGMSGEGSLKLVGTSKNLVSFKIEMEFIGLIRRINLEKVNLKAEFTLAFELEIFELVDIEYSLEGEWDVDLPWVAVAGLGLALGFPPLPP